MTESAPKPEYASFNRRMFAAGIDLFIIMLVAEPATQWLIEHMFAPLDKSPLAALSTPEVAQDASQVLAGLWQYTLQYHVIERMLVENIVQTLFIALYTIPCWLHYSATPGKTLVGITIRDAVTGEPMTRRQCVIRFLGYIVSGVPLTLGFIWAIFNKKKQGWHDMMAGTVVIRRRRRKS